MFSTSLSNCSGTSNPVGLGSFLVVPVQAFIARSASDHSGTWLDQMAAFMYNNCINMYVDAKRTIASEKETSEKKHLLYFYKYEGKVVTKLWNLWQ